MNLQAVALTLGLFGGLSALLAFSRALSGRRAAAIGHLLLAAVLGATAAVAWQVALNLESYGRLAYERPLADIDFEQLARYRFRVTLTRLPDGKMQEFELAGDEWRLEARLFQWQGWASAAGLEPRIRLESLAGRQVAGSGGQQTHDTVYPLAENPGLDLWSLASAGGRWAGMIRPGSAGAGFLPMTKGASYRIRMSQKGLVVRPQNEAAEQALQSAATG